LPWLLLVLALLTVYAYAVWRAAWVGDDALITMRVVDNFVSGEGLRWNPTDRVQVSTHPLWMFGLSAAYGITGDAYFAPLWLSGLCLVGTFALLLSSRLLPLRGAVLALTLLIASKSFVDYSTSGLENPLSFLLVTWLFVALERRVNREGRFLPLALASSLLILNRPDHAVLVAPVLLIGAWGRPLWETLRDLVVGFAPLLLWLAFATLYFGTPIPITAHAKALSLGVPQEQMMAQALNYFADAGYRDPVTLLGLALALVLLLMGLVRRAPRTQLAMGLSVLLSLLYLFKIGGDFMAGRFFATPLLLAAILLARSQLVARLQNPALLGAAALVLGASFLSSPPTLLSPSVYGGFELSPKGVVDERAHYYEGLGLRSPGRIPLIAGALSPMIEADPSPVPRHVVVQLAVGFKAFIGGRAMHVVDPLLTDPLLARLPVYEPEAWLPGHGRRRIPLGYLESRATGENRIQHPALRRYYERLRLVTQGPLLSRERLAAMWQLWTDDSDLQSYLAEAYRRHESTSSVPLERLQQALAPDGTVLPLHWSDPRALLLELDSQGVTIELPALSQAKALRLGLDVLDDYELEFRRGEVALAKTLVSTVSVRLSGIQAFDVLVPPAAAEQGFDAIHVFAKQCETDGISAIGGLVLIDE
jgi:arabinofuranosyltransferase